MAFFNSTSQQPSLDPTAAWFFIVNSSWLAVPIVAAIGWINTWLVSAIITSMKGDSVGFVADRRYDGSSENTLFFLVSSLYQTRGRNRKADSRASNTGG